MAKHSVGLDISDHTIEVAELSGNKVASLSRIKLPPRVVEHGRVKDEKQLALALSQLFSSAKPRPISAKEVVFGLPESQVFTHTFLLEPHAKKEREELILREVATNVPIPADDVLFSYKVLQEDKDGVKILLAAASGQVVKEWQEFFRKIKIDIKIFDIEVLASFRDLFPKIPENPVCLVDIGTRSTHIGFFTKKGLEYSFSSPIAGKSFTDSLVESLGVDVSQAVKMKKTIGISPKDKKVALALAGVAGKIIGEIEETIKYFQQKTVQPISDTILLGGTSQMKGLAGYLKHKLGLEVVLGESSLVQGAPLEYIEAVGLALRGINKKWDKRDLSIPFYKERKNKKTKNKNRESIIGTGDVDKSKSLLKQITLLSIIVAIGAGTVIWAFSYRNNQRSAKEEKIKMELEQLGVLGSDVQDIQSVADVPNVEVDNAATTTEKVVMVEILQNNVGFLNVREGAGTNFAVAAKVLPGESYELLEEAEQWIKIKLSEDQSGWVSSNYIKKIESVDEI